MSECKIKLLQLFCLFLWFLEPPLGPLLHYTYKLPVQNIFWKRSISITDIFVPNQLHSQLAIQTTCRIANNLSVFMAAYLSIKLT